MRLMLWLSIWWSRVLVLVLVVCLLWMCMVLKLRVEMCRLVWLRGFRIMG